MPDYMYLLESRLSPEQRAALERVQELARAQNLNAYLTGDAVRELISGRPIRNLDFTVEGNPQRIVRELEKGGARVTWESERLRQYELVFAGDADGSLSAARDDVYERPGAKPEYRFGGIMEDLRRRDFSINAIAISLNVQSRGLLLDPTNGLADLERQEVRTLSIHAFTNQPALLLRILRYVALTGCKMESRTQEWFELALNRGLDKNIAHGDAGQELRSLAHDENPVPALQQWEARGLLAAIHPQLQRRKPAYDRLNKLARVRMNYLAAGLRPRLQTAALTYILGRLKARECAAALRDMGFRSAEIDAIASLVPEAQKIVKMLKSAKTSLPRDAYFYLASVPAELLVFIEVQLPDPRALSKIRNYIQKWRPMRLALPVAELDAMGVPRGPKFDSILEHLFEKQLRGKARTPEDRTKALRELAGIKEAAEKKPPKKQKGKETQSAAASDATEAKAHHSPQASPHAQSGTDVDSTRAKPQKAKNASQKAHAKPHSAGKPRRR